MTKVAMADLANESLDKRVTSFWNTRGRHSREGLVLLDVCINRAASEARDWDGLARFFSSALKYQQGPVIKRIIRAAFGDKLVWKADSNHAAGGTFVIGWEGAFNLAGSNTYGVVRQAVEAGEGWDDKAFAVRIGKVLPKTVVVRTATPEATAKAIKHLATYMDKLAKDGFNVGEVIAGVQKDMAAKRAEVGDVVKKVVNGVTVYEPKF